MTHPVPDATTMMRRMMARQTPTRRLQMASGMFATARALVKAGMRETDRNEREYIFLRFYGNDFSPIERAKILKAIGTRGAP